MFPHYFSKIGGSKVQKLITLQLTQVLAPHGKIGRVDPQYVEFLCNPFQPDHDMSFWPLGRIYLDKIIYVEKKNNLNAHAMAVRYELSLHDLVCKIKFYALKD